MDARASEQSWFGSQTPSAEDFENTSELSRTWQGFIAARITLGLVLLGLQAGLYFSGIANNHWLVVICLAYFLSTLPLGVRWKTATLGTTFSRPWLRMVGLDLLAFSSLQLLHGSSINYTPLFALPILLASVLGSLQLALGTAAGATVFLLGSTLWGHWRDNTQTTAQLVQAALSSAGYFAVAFLANQLATRLANEGRRAHQSQRAAQVQRQVNALVIESLPDGLLIVDGEGVVRGANPAAQEMLGGSRNAGATLRDLKSRAELAPLLHVTRVSIGSGQGQEDNVTLRFDGKGPLRLRVRTRLTNPLGLGGETLCVLFLQDQHELEARMRTERLASMGRMSTAVAHEIRNPLAAITQANALLGEELSTPQHRRLTDMVNQNALRLSRIVEDILDATRVPERDGRHAISVLDLNDAVQRICRDWQQQNPCGDSLHIALAPGDAPVRFDTEHLQRVLINLLDNALRYASGQPQSIQVHASPVDAQRMQLCIWSDGPPMDQTVERHLFEPFFSSQSRSNGLGLYICRELCEGHGAQIGYARKSLLRAGQLCEGNAFEVLLVRLQDNGAP